MPIFLIPALPLTLWCVWTQGAIDATFSEEPRSWSAMTGFLVAGTASGVGKTTVTLALIVAMRRRGLTVQVFKGGPDFLDAGHLTRASGRSARNLDTWMLSHEANCQVLREGACGAGAVVVEGMMGLFDGKDGATETGSTAEIAKLSKLPVVLVLDAGKSARSIAAVVLGFELFDPGLNIAGVVLNRVASERHFAMLTTAIKSGCRTPVLGWLPRDPAIAIAERHLGLRSVEDSEEGAEGLYGRLAELAEKHLDLEALLALQRGLEISPEPLREAKTTLVRIGVARDRAFSFYYEDNFDLLQQCGAELVFFSPMSDAALPEGLDALYLGGGYPELYAAILSENAGMLATVREFAASRRPVYAECGGMIYLARHLTTADGDRYAMAGVLRLDFEMTPKLVNFGYVTVQLTRDCLLGTEGTEVRGHSFHYSRRVGEMEMETCYCVRYSLSGKEEFEGFRCGNLLASYVHLHFRAQPSVARSFVQAARLVKEDHLVMA